MAEEKKFLGQMLVERELVTEQQLKDALEKQRESGHFLGRILVDLGYIEEKDLKRVLSIQSGVEMIDLKNTAIDHRAIEVFPSALAKTYNAVPVKL
jgi:type IV pilus assembly protein PilB